ncbi:hypothetical protein Rsub_02616 [Raphidocelis subcapitata]|uniref:Chloride conductance regulatory protein ICln n=1 Tax=Raphidocelis subcapitata TaxID=307507 RepID=A0A2V0NTB5_9CHLO|nr:hypothetical protein Rsub_02616 [Raphidocelis subcapitata]|eukprot:GBF89912.1 hypothetical protein Rsub_02616 [Raphidocelis subcapitata]
MAAATAQQLAEFASRLGVATGVAPASGGAPPLDADAEELAATFEDVEAAIGDDGLSLGKGTAYVTTRRIVWVPASGEPSKSLALRYPQIIMHAVSNDTSSFSRPCVYLQLDEGDDGGDGGAGGFGGFGGGAGGGGGAGVSGSGSGGEEGEGEEDGEEDLGAELRLVPADAAAVEAIFKAMCDCSALNPDSDNEDDGQAELFFDEAEVLAGLPADQRDALMAARAEGLGVGDDMDALVAGDPDRFGDDDEAEEEEEGEEDEDEEEGGGAQAVAGAGVRQGNGAPAR